jgi:hypothetical protein
LKYINANFNSDVKSIREKKKKEEEYLHERNAKLFYIEGLFIKVQNQFISKLQIICICSTNSKNVNK